MRSRQIDKEEICLVSLMIKKMKHILKKIIIFILTLEAKLVLKKYKPKIVGITGSVGKTSTKDAIFTALQTTYFVRKTEKSFNSEIGIPLTILGLPNGWNDPRVWFLNIIKGLKVLIQNKEYPKWLVLEIGADRPGDIARVMSWLKIDVAVFTRIGKVPVHVEFYASVADVVKEKSNLLNGLKRDGVIVLNQDDEDLLVLKENKKHQHITFSLQSKADVSASYPSIVYEDDVPKGMSVKVDVAGSSFPVLLKQALGSQHIYPILASFCVAKYLDINLIRVSLAFDDHKCAPGRMNLIAGKNNMILIDDTYNASPLAVEEGFELVKTIKTNKRKIAIIGDMLELGRHSVTEHIRLGECGANVFDVMVAVGMRAKDFLDGARNKKMSKKNLHWFESSLEAKDQIDSILQDGDVVYIKGSQGARMERIVEVLLKDRLKQKKLLVRQEEEWQQR